MAQAENQAEKAQVEVESNKWCSWCFQNGTHYKIEQKYLERNTYRCAYCCNDTKCCTLCSEGMVNIILIKLLFVVFLRLFRAGLQLMAQINYA